MSLLFFSVDYVDKIIFSLRCAEKKVLMFEYIFPLVLVSMRNPFRHGNPLPLLQINTSLYLMLCMVPAVCDFTTFLSPVPPDFSPESPKHMLKFGGACLKAISLLHHYVQIHAFILM